jgi:hypothetical protein
MWLKSQDKIKWFSQTSPYAFLSHYDISFSRYNSVNYVSFEEKTPFVRGGLAPYSYDSYGRRIVPRIFF